LPQIEGNSGNVSLANYWVEAVSGKSKYINEAWDFVQFATEAEQAKLYLAKTDKPTALRSLVSEQIANLNVNSFAEQVLTAKSWYHGKDANAAELIMGEMIDSAVKGEAKIEDVINLGAKSVQQTMK
jgi:ABC-type glycerol-3-phosphate transport system substrate-binding protein